MKTSAPRPLVSGFTLIEMLVVIAIIAVLAGILLPVVATMKEKGRRAQALTEVKSIAAAISQYQSLYSAYPSSKEDVAQAGAADLSYTNNNTNIMIILLDVKYLYPNQDHARNPQQHVFLNLKLAANTSSPGLGPDYNYRDPWGRPYEITLDLNFDSKCDDVFYGSLPTPVAVWSLGRDGLPLTKDDIRSW